MKTIADYQPDILIREAIALLAEHARHGVSSQDEFHLVTMLAVNDVCRKGLDGNLDDVAAWLADEINAHQHEDCD